MEGLLLFYSISLDKNSSYDHVYSPQDELAGGCREREPAGDELRRGHRPNSLRKVHR